MAFVVWLILCTSYVLLVLHFAFCFYSVRIIFKFFKYYCSCISTYIYRRLYFVSVSPCSYCQRAQQDFHSRICKSLGSFLLFIQQQYFNLLSFMCEPIFVIWSIFKAMTPFHFVKKHTFHVSHSLHHESLR